MLKGKGRDYSRGAGILTGILAEVIVFTGNGKGFPAYESFIEDAAGTKIMLGTYAPPNKGRVDRLNMFSGINIPIDGMDRKEVLLQTDEKGNFMGVLDPKAGVVQSAAAYNETQTSKPASSDVKK